MMEQEEAFYICRADYFCSEKQRSTETLTLSKALAKLKIFRFIMMISEIINTWEGVCT